MSALSPLERADSDDISIPHMTDVFQMKREEGLRSTRPGNKLNFHGTRCEQFNNGSQVTATQVNVRDVPCKSNGIK